MIDFIQRRKSRLSGIARRLPLIAVSMAGLLALSSCGRQQTDAEEVSASSSSAQAVSSSVSSSAEGGSSGAPVATLEPTATPTPKPTPTPPPEIGVHGILTEDPDTVSLLMVGDILLHERVSLAAKDENGAYDYRFIFQNTREQIQAADLAIVNQEVIIGGEEMGVTGYPIFNAPDEIGDALADAGFDVVLHATNHAMDMGAEGLLHTMNYWKTKHPEMTVAGINASQEEQDTLRIVERDGIRIAVLNYTFGLNGLDLPWDMPWSINMLYNEDRLISDLQRAEQEADFTIVCPHWGNEYELGYTDDQAYLAELFRQHGADLVLGAHPHVIEPIEWCTPWAEDGESRLPVDATAPANNKGNGNMLVYYSVGNFVSWSICDEYDCSQRVIGGMAELKIGRTENGDVAILDYGIEPIVTQVEYGREAVVVYPLADYTNELANRHEAILEEPLFSREYCVDLCKRVWGNTLEEV